MFTGHITGDIIHGTRAIQGNEGDDFLKTIRLHGFQDLAHARTFQLKQAHGLTGGQKFKGFGIIQGQGVQVYIFPCFPRNHFTAQTQDAEGFQTQKVKLNQPRLFNIFHTVLCHRHIGSGITVKRHHLLQRLIPNHNTSSVG